MRILIGFLAAVALAGCAMTQSQDCVAGQFRSRFDLAQDQRDAFWPGGPDCVTYSLYRAAHPGPVLASAAPAPAPAQPIAAQMPAPVPVAEAIPVQPPALRIRQPAVPQNLVASAAPPARLPAVPKL
jgi:hypothetical protein